MKTSFVNKVEVAELKTSFTENKLEGLKRRRKPSQVDFIIKVEKLYQTYAYNPTKQNEQQLLRELSFSISKKAVYWENKWKNKRLCKEDFESAFYEAAWELTTKYNYYCDFYYYETLCLVWERKAIDITRKLKTKKGKFQTSILPLDKGSEEFISDGTNMEEDIVNYDLVVNILNDENLTKLERQLLKTLYTNPDLSYRDIAEELGLNHHEQVRRILSKINKKLAYSL